MTTAANTTLTAWGGLPKDLTSTKCSFFNYLTSFKVASKIALASATAASAFSAIS